MQAQAMVQFVCNIVDFKMELQEAIETPRAASHSFPWSYHPHPYRPGLMHIESGTQENVPEQLQALGHRVQKLPVFSYGMGAVCAVGVDGGSLIGGSDPRRDGCALAW